MTVKSSHKYGKRVLNQTICFDILYAYFDHHLLLLLPFCLHCLAGELFIPTHTRNGKVYGFYSR